MIPTQAPSTPRITTPTPDQQAPHAMNESERRIRPSRVPRDDDMLVNSPPRFLVRHARAGRSSHRRFRPQPRRPRARREEEDRNSRSTSRQHHGRSRSPLQFRPRSRRSSIGSEDDECHRRPRPGHARFARPWHAPTPGTPSPHGEPVLCEAEQPCESAAPQKNHQFQTRCRPLMPNPFATDLTQSEANTGGDAVASVATGAQASAVAATTMTVAASRPRPWRPTGIAAVRRVLNDPADDMPAEAKTHSRVAEWRGIAQVWTARTGTDEPLSGAPHGSERVMTAPVALHPTHREETEGERLHALVSENLSLLTLQDSALVRDPVTEARNDDESSKLRAQACDAGAMTATTAKPAEASIGKDGSSLQTTEVEPSRGDADHCAKPVLNTCGRLPSNKQQQEQEHTRLQAQQQQQQQQQSLRRPLQFRPLSRSESSSASLP